MTLGLTEEEEATVGLTEEGGDTEFDRGRGGDTGFDRGRGGDTGLDRGRGVTLAETGTSSLSCGLLCQSQQMVAAGTDNNQKAINPGKAEVRNSMLFK